jgi:uncharacterized membrane protein
MSEPAEIIEKLAAEKMIGMSLALASGVLIGISFIITKKGLMDSNRMRGSIYSYIGNVPGEGYEYLKNAMWWAGTITMVLGEAANFLAYSYAPAILVTPLGAVSVLVGYSLINQSAILSSIFLNEKLGKDGTIGCVLCILGTVSVILHAPEEAAIETVDDVFHHFIQPIFLLYMTAILMTSLYLIYYVGPIYGKTHMLVYITICSLVGSISVMAVKGFAVAVKLTFAGENQFQYFSTWVFGVTVVVCAMTQVNYFNKALDLFSTNRVTPGFGLTKLVYYVFFTSATVIASVILSQGIKRSTPV